MRQPKQIPTNDASPNNPKQAMNTARKEKTEKSDLVGSSHPGNLTAFSLRTAAWESVVNSLEKNLPWVISSFNVSRKS